MVIGKEPGDSTMIRVTYEVKEMLEEEKIIPREPLNDCIKRGILANREHRKHHNIETRDDLLKEFISVTTNPDIKNWGNNENNHRDIWNNYHPEDPLSPEWDIHHINGNHNDNRIENLQKVSHKEHAELHKELKKENPPLKATKGEPTFKI